VSDSCRHFVIVGYERQFVGDRATSLSGGLCLTVHVGEPGMLLRRRYLTAARAMRETGKLACMVINDLDAGVVRRCKLKRVETRVESA